MAVCFLVQKVSPRQCVQGDHLELPEQAKEGWCEYVVDPPSNQRFEYQGDATGFKESKPLGVRDVVFTGPEIGLRVSVANEWFKIIDEGLRGPILPRYLKGAKAFLANRSGLLKIDGGSRDQQKMRRMLIELAATKPGAELLCKLYETCQEVIIVLDRNCESYCGLDPKGRLIVSLNDSIDVYNCGITRAGEGIIYKQDLRVRLFHELKHNLDYLTGAYVAVDQSKLENLINPEFHSENEQNTIVGTKRNKDKISIRSENGVGIALAVDTDAIGSDGVWRTISGADLVRIDHCGVNMPEEKKPGIAQFADMPTGLPLIQKIAVEQPQDFNQTYFFLIEPVAGMQLYPLSVALMRGRSAIVESILSSPEVNVNNIDDAGVPLEIALGFGRFELIEAIVRHPTFDAAQSVGVIRWRSYLNRARAGKAASSVATESANALGVVVSARHELDPFFEKLRNAGDELMGCLYKKDGALTEEAVNKAIQFTVEFMEVRSRFQDLIIKEIGARIDDARIAPYLEYLVEMKIEDVIGAYVTDYLSRIDDSLCRELVGRAADMDIDGRISDLLIAFADATVRDRYNAERVSNIVVLLASDVDDPEGETMAAIDQGAEALAEFLYTNWSVVDTLRQVGNAVIKN